MVFRFETHITAIEAQGDWLKQNLRDQAEASRRIEAARDAAGAIEFESGFDFHMNRDPVDHESEDVDAIDNGFELDVESVDPLVKATKHPLTTETLEKQLGRLGGTGYHLHQLTADISRREMPGVCQRAAKSGRMMRRCGEKGGIG